ncbi:hypothetical protein [Salinarchaeum chitinilyticum]
MTGRSLFLAVIEASRPGEILEGCLPVINPDGTVSNLGYHGEDLSTCNYIQEGNYYS